MNQTPIDNIAESNEIERINLLRANLDTLRPKSYSWLIQWGIFGATIAAIVYIAEFDLLAEQNFVWFLLLLVTVCFNRCEDYLAHKRIDLLIKLLDKRAFDKL
ncbi:hypothetical protein H5123_17530 [Shewanella sp. SR43-4]|jgi:hypothetical protein|uniref:Uncharacterized protein n=1 Tax=Shewanella vesiculosa TaxID=518738 RepID=A0ABV0FUR6_9GAMM|nr:MULTISPECIES: hypothetical protein [Shewanella]NCQ46816.1 hypothetical protein [Shewanella frigidimarina]MBB1319425.1 hypothetical protein [Shewanella sp. SR43-4]MBB1323770.1 hypothetical protein [Shewanella sp. SR43-8]MBB1391294.1 hypothetical protein [Shewanella sp. SG44-6]NCO73301.1 hypothetical protein [Shewanella vesiculosa]